MIFVMGLTDFIISFVIVSNEMFVVLAGPKAL
jgi:hypothetical protein